MNKFLAIVLFSMFSSLSVSAQDRVSIKTNLLYGGLALTPNLSVEVGLTNQMTLNISGSYNWFNLKSTSVSNKKRVHAMVQPEFRYFLHERFNGHFFGVHAIGSTYNIGGYSHPLLLGDGSQNFRYEGHAVGAGVSYGYQLPIADRWNIEFNLGVGYIHMKYNQFDHTKCGLMVGKDMTRGYFGPTKAGITIMFLL